MNKNFISSDDDDEDCGVEGIGDIKVHKNHVYFYSQVTQASILSLNLTLLKVAQSREFNTHFGPEGRLPIILHVNSYGGEVYSGMSVVDTLRSLPTEVHTLVDGVAASASAGIVIAGKKRYIRPHGYMMIHQLSSGCMGTHEEFKDEIANQESLMKMIKDFYLENTKIKPEDLNSLLKRNLFFNAEQCIEMGLVDALWNQ